ncbi:WD40/YVTN/BNR-like repeat-containing protein [Halomonas sp. CSM-2]|uniref:WD40/YVTN/BNR-like repeat-containing protein n=1 Tax=Halomonas sp. CSM-2 TaxID=1975722 RepID=UPI000A28A9D3|nr:YCF48-related protein [Halomonas sp. CSM-2]
MRIIIRCFLHVCLRAGLAAVSFGIASTALATEEGLLSLHYDVAGKRLLKIEANQLFQRTDEGMAWNAITLPEDMAEGQLRAVSAPSTDPQTLYIAGPSIGVQRSTDNGETWQELSANLPSREVTALTVHRRQNETLYAVIAEDGIYQSGDAGTTWKKMDSGPSQKVNRFIHSNMDGSMQTGWLYAVSGDAVRLSMDCFCGWRPTGELDAGSVYDVAYDLDGPKRVYVATQQGLWRSENGGQEWQQIDGDGTVLVTLTLSPQGILYGLNHKGELLHSEDEGQSWTYPDA